MLVVLVLIVLCFCAGLINGVEKNPDYLGNARFLSSSEESE